MKSGMDVNGGLVCLDHRINVEALDGVCSLEMFHPGGARGREAWFVVFPVEDRWNSLDVIELIGAMSAHAWLVLQERGAPPFVGSELPLAMLEFREL